MPKLYEAMIPQWENFRVTIAHEDGRTKIGIPGVTEWVIVTEESPVDLTIYPTPDGPVKVTLGR
jgi:hypothetical protein